MSKSDSVHKYSARFREVRTLLGLTQAELGEKLFVSQNYIAQIESGRRTTPSMQLLNALESLAVSIDPVNKSTRTDTVKKGVNEYRETGSGRSLKIEEANSISDPVVAPRYPSADRSPSTRADVEEYMKLLIEAASNSGNPNAWPVLHDRLKKRFPLDEWLEESE